VETLRPLYKEYLGCKESNNRRKAVSLECNREQQEFEADYCTYASDLETKCSTYSRCRSVAIGARGGTHDAVRKAEEARKADWVTATHILCLLRVFETDNGDKKARLDECMDATVSTENITVVYHQIPDADPCPTEEHVPCDEAWLQMEYRSKAWYNSSTINQCIACQAPAPPTPAPDVSVGQLTVLSNDHSNGAAGMYFNFDVGVATAVLGAAPDANTFTITQYRDGTAIKTALAIFWSGANGGSVGDGHGRWHPYDEAQAGQWEVGDKISLA